MALEGLVNEQGRLAETFPKFDPETIQHSDEITNDRRSDKELTRKWFWTADFPMYTIEDNNAILYFARRENNFIFKNIEEATEQLIKTNNYVPKKEDIGTVINSESTLRVDLSELKLKEGSSEYSYFEIDVAKYSKKLNKAQRAFAERVYGQKDNFKKNMKMLKNAGINTTRIYVLNPKYVKDNVKKDSAVARACGLDDFDDDSDFYAVDWGVVPYFWLRGVLAEGDARKIVTLPEDKMHGLLEKYVAPVNLPKIKQEMQKLYK